MSRPKYKSNEQGRCPYCNEYTLEYGAIEADDADMIHYPWICENCKRTGEEWYEINFIGHNDDEGNPIEVEGE